MAINRRMLTFPITLREDVLGKSPLKVSQIKQPSPHMSEDLQIDKVTQTNLKGNDNVYITDIVMR